MDEENPPRLDEDSPPNFEKFANPRNLGKRAGESRGAVYRKEETLGRKAGLSRCRKDEKGRSTARFGIVRMFSLGSVNGGEEGDGELDAQ